MVIGQAASGFKIVRLSVRYEICQHAQLVSAASDSIESHQELGTCHLTARWNSSHLLSVAKEGQKFNYKLTSTVLVNIQEKTLASLSNCKMKNMHWSTSLTRQTEILGSSRHVVNLGRMIESSEKFLRAQIAGIHLGKTGDISSAVRTVSDRGKGLSHNKLLEEAGKDLINELDTKLSQR